MKLPYIIAVDFDGTLCSNQWPDIGEVNIDVFGYLFQAKYFGGAKIILWTCRTGFMLEDAVKWCKERGLEFDAINDNIAEAVIEFGGNGRKVFANEYIDDKSSTRFKLPYMGCI